MLTEMRKTQAVFLLFSLAGLLLLSLFTTIVSAQAQDNQTIYFFYKQGCPYCADESVFLDTIADKYPELIIEKYNIFYNQTITDLFMNMCESYGTATFGVPKIFIGDKYVSGYSGDSTTGVKIENMIRKYLGYSSKETEDVIKIPFIGEIKTSEMSLPALTIVIGLLDGFNPCAMFILCFLLVFLIGTKSRKKVFIIGGIFLFISGIVYFLFISTWFNFFVVFKFVPMLKLVVGTLVIVAGLINIKDYFFFQKGVSLTLPKSWKPKVMERMKRISELQSLTAMVFGVVTVAFVVNVVELMCTIGFPMIYTQILATYNLSQTAYYLYILLYCVMYMIDDFLLFTVAVATLSCMEMTQKRVRLMKLISGVLMVLLAIWFVLS